MRFFGNVRWYNIKRNTNCLQNSQIQASDSGPAQSLCAQSPHMRHLTHVSPWVSFENSMPQKIHSASSESGAVFPIKASVSLSVSNSIISSSSESD
ncbi:unnamed protein product [Acanthoscelides obtectus]|uniref:Uncharacterized protein n=1 Tax=Acanthoscelides obtectus TaxID=200917 RepID=A0A9P0LRP2_ACAOB|nr:unnamed protein product [Acanthoscelides obtectus]CAK1686121.1 hypothetical protein AOBTE_LOCUS35795 [Acanthoscelides obtectus]